LLEEREGLTLLLFEDALLARLLLLANTEDLRSKVGATVPPPVAMRASDGPADFLGTAPPAPSTLFISLPLLTGPDGGFDKEKRAHDAKPTI
jgi:hypothetical protein